MFPLLFRLLRQFANAVRWLVVVASCWGTMADSLWAADEADGEKGWLASYSLIGLCVFLGLIAVLRPVGRTTEVKVKMDD